MCRNIRVLHHFEPPTTQEEIRAAAEQFVRKVSGVTKPPKSDAEEIARAIDAITAATRRLLDNLPERGAVRTRERERERARERWVAREARIKITTTPSKTSGTTRVRAKA